MKKFFLAASLMVLAGCGALGLAEDATPRERALDLMLRYEGVQIAAEGVVTSVLLQDKPDVRQAVKAATRTATDAVLRYDDVTRGCKREQVTNEQGEVVTMIVLIPGLLCEPDTARALFPVAQSAMIALRQELIDLEE